MSDKSKILTLSQLAHHLGVSRPTMYKMLKQKTFDVKPIKGTTPRRWKLELVNIWLNGK